MYKYILQLLIWRDFCYAIRHCTMHRKTVIQYIFT